jgi:predicted ABC-type transport system involved in lysophospholipase L1 biosynthesis ATPase subunit
MSGPLLALEQVTVRRPPPELRSEGPVLRAVDLAIGPREIVGVIGLGERSGKSTLLRVLAGLHPPDEGRVLLEGRSLYEMGARERAEVLRSTIGFADPNALLPSRCERVVELVALALLGGGLSMQAATSRARRALSEAGVTACGEMSPVELTRAERVRVAIARAIARDPKVLLVDEPAALPDPDEISAVIGLLREIARRRGIALVIASQDPAALRRVDRAVHVTAGALKTSDRRGGRVLPFPQASGT